MHNERVLRRNLILLISVAVAAGGLATASATAAGASVPHSVNKSRNFAGYSASIPGTVSAFTGTVSAPVVTCPSAISVFVEPAVVLQTPADVFNFGTSVDCSGGSAAPELAFADVFPAGTGSTLAETSIHVAPGDVVTMSLKISAGVATLKISDTSAGTSDTITAHVSGSLTIVNAGTHITWAGSPAAVPKFKPVMFGSLKVGSAPLTSLSLTEWEIFKGSTLQVSTSKISSAGSFKNTFVHS